MPPLHPMYRLKGFSCVYMKILTSQNISIINPSDTLVPLFHRAGCRGGGQPAREARVKI